MHYLFLVHSGHEHRVAHVTTGPGALVGDVALALEALERGQSEVHDNGDGARDLLIVSSHDGSRAHVRCHASLPLLRSPLRSGDEISLADSRPDEEAARSRRYSRSPRDPAQHTREYTCALRVRDSSGAVVAHVPLTGDSRRALSLGTAFDCDIRLPDASLRTLHAPGSDATPQQDVSATAGPGPRGTVAILEGTHLSVTSDAVQLMSDGHHVTSVDLTHSTHVQLHGCTIDLHHVGGRDTHIRSDIRVGHRVAARSIAVPTDPGIPLPSAPKDGSDPSFPWVMALVPILIAGVLWTLTQSRFVLMFAILMPTLAVANFVNQRRRVRLENARAHAEFDDQCSVYEWKIQQAHAHEREVMHEAFHDPDTREDDVRRRGLTLWAVGPAQWMFGTVRVGIGETASVITAPLDEAVDRPPDLENRLRELVEAARVLDDAPVTLNALASASAVVGAEESAGILRSLLLALASSHSPLDLQIRVLGPASHIRDLECVQWLPHARHPRIGQAPALSTLQDDAPSGAVLLEELERLVADRRRAARSHETPSGDHPDQSRAALQPHVLVCISDPIEQAMSASERSRWLDLTERAQHMGVTLMWRVSHRERVPAGCTQVLHVTTERDASLTGHLEDLTRHTASPVRRFDTLTLEHARSIARALCPIIDEREDDAVQAELPRSLPLLEAIGLDPQMGADTVLQRWRSSDLGARDLGSSFAHNEHGPTRISLRKDGPHALVAGTTGSGKSELLRSWVLSLAATYSPQALTFLFVDYKGGAAFGPCTELPHCVGLVTDLNEGLIDRALVSLRAELLRREKTLSSHGFSDIEELEEAIHASKASDGLPALLIVIDEFAALMREAPAFIDDIVDIAARGRSLGIHLILATQRPAGVISERIRANTNLRIALRLADTNDSRDVIGNEAAAHISPSTAGRALIRRGAGQALPMHVGYSGARPADRLAEPLVRIDPGALEDGAPITVWSPKPAPTPTAPLETNLETIVAMARLAFHSGGYAQPRRPWLPPLADHYTVEELNAARDSDHEGQGSDQPAHPHGRAPMIAITDEPYEQRQRTLSLRFEHGAHLCVGAPGSGVVDALHTMLWAAATSGAHVYGIAGAGSPLLRLHNLPHCGALVRTDDTDRLMRLLRTLVAWSLGRRPRNGPPLVFAVDSYEALMDVLSLQESNDAINALQTIVRDGPRNGVIPIIGTSRVRAVPGSITSSITNRAFFTLAHKDDALAAGLTLALADNAPPGRAIVTGWGERAERHAQFALARTAPEPPPPAIAPLPVHPFPVSLSYAQLPQPRHGYVVLGVDWDMCAPVEIRASGVVVIVRADDSHPFLLGDLAARSTHKMAYLDLAGLGLPGWLLADRNDREIRHLRSTHDVQHFTQELMDAFDQRNRSEQPALGHDVESDTWILVIERCAHSSLSAHAPIITALIDVMERRADFVLAQSLSREFSKTQPVCAALISRGRAVLQGLKETELFQAFHIQAKVPNIDRSIPGRAFLVERGSARVIHVASEKPRHAPSIRERSSPGQDAPGQ